MSQCPPPLATHLYIHNMYIVFCLVVCETEYVKPLIRNYMYICTHLHTFKEINYINEKVYLFCLAEVNRLTLLNDSLEKAKSEMEGSLGETLISITYMYIIYNMECVHIYVIM